MFADRLRPLTDIINQRSHRTTHPVQEPHHGSRLDTIHPVLLSRRAFI